MPRSGYRARGADLPFTDRRRAHGIAMEGYFWRITDARSGRVVVALCGVCAPGWATVALAAHPGGLLATEDVVLARAEPHRLGVSAMRADGSGALHADASSLHVDLGPGARLDVALADPFPRRAPALGGVGPAHLLPGLGQYWDPWLLRGVAVGHARLGTEAVTLRGARVYAEKNWGPGGFPPRWWWGQAQDFDRDDVTVAFAGGVVAGGMTASAIVVRLGERMIRLGNPLLAPARARVDEKQWTLRARGPVWSAAIEGRAVPGTEHVLPVPDLAARRSEPAAHEHLAGVVSLVLRRRGRVVYAGESPLAGLESGRRSAREQPGEQVGGLRR